MGRFFIQFFTISLIIGLVFISAGAEEGSSAKSASTHTNYDFSFTNVYDFLKPPNTDSPRATLQSFIENMNRAYGMLMKAHRTNLKTPGIISSESALQMTKQAREYFENGVECLNLSRIPKHLKKNAGYEGAIMLKEIFDRIDLPPFSEIPDDEEINAEKDQIIRADLIRWRIPNTDIIIDRVAEGPRKGEFLFTPGTVARIEEYFNKIKAFPYKLNALISHDFFDFYATTPGRLLPPKWIQWLPNWSNQTYHDQTLWQWCALIVLPVVFLLLVWHTVRWWYQRATQLSSGKKTIGWLLLILGTMAMVSLINYILDAHINITGPILVFLDTTLQRLFILGLIGLILWEFIKALIKKKIEEGPQEESRGEEGGAGGSRSETLLLLLRKTIIFVMFTVLTLLLLSSIGINIGPLLAGAGVIGLAIGFGAQTLVKDIIAGIFFLVDDAFRVGDFIETSGLKGMVEHISLRSLRLRSHLGPVHTIPFGSMDTVTNNSRD